MFKSVVAVSFLLYTSCVFADANDNIEAAVGGGIGGAVGAVVGNEIGDRKSAIVASAIGAAIGTAITTDETTPKQHRAPEVAVDISIGDVAKNSGHPNARHCPPGQAKKGRC